MSESESGFESVRLERDESVAVVTIDRPERLNALDNETLEEIAEAMEEVFLDDDVCAAVLTGAGEKAFVAGADIQMLAEQGVLDGRENSRLGQDVMDLLEDGPKPVIAAVNGFALGGGLELALACDFRYASTNAVLGLPEVTLGTIPGYGGTQRLPLLVGTGQGLELILTGEKIDAEEALRIGLVNRLFPPGELLPAAKATAAKIGKRGPVAVRFAKEAVRRGLLVSRKDGLMLESDLFGLVSDTADMKEGMTAFLEKRKPVFEGG